MLTLRGFKVNFLKQTQVDPTTVQGGLKPAAEKRESDF